MDKVNFLFQLAVFFPVFGSFLISSRNLVNGLKDLVPFQFRYLVAGSPGSGHPLLPETGGPPDIPLVPFGNSQKISTGNRSGVIGKLFAQFKSLRGIAHGLGRLAEFDFLHQAVKHVNPFFTPGRSQGEP